MASILIYGGCVLRDAFQHLPGHTLVDYIARQSLISGTSSAANLLAANGLTSGFQKRSLQGDIDSTLLRAIRRKGPQTDLILMDILSDRLGVFQTVDGAFVTNSVELKASGLMESTRSVRFDFGTDEHFALWKRAVTRFMKAVKDAGLENKILIIETPWAGLDDEGNPSVAFRGTNAAEGNARYKRYYAHMRRVGVPVMRIPQRLVVASASHKWGAAPYHYTEPAYLWIRDTVKKKIRSQKG